MMDDRTELLDELTTQLSHAQVELAVTSITLKYNEAINIVKNHVMAGSSMGLVPFALFDIVALSANQHLMVKHLCRHYDVEFDVQRSKLLVISLMTGSLPALTVIGLSSLSKFIPVIGTLGGSASVAISGGAVTYATGQTFIRHFSLGGNLDNFIVNQYSGFFKKQLTNGKNFLSKKKLHSAPEGAL